MRSKKAINHTSQDIIAKLTSTNLGKIVSLSRDDMKISITRNLRVRTRPNDQNLFINYKEYCESLQAKEPIKSDQGGSSRFRLKTITDNRSLCTPKQKFSSIVENVMSPNTVSNPALIEENTLGGSNSRSKIRLVNNLFVETSFRKSRRQQETATLINESDEEPDPFQKHESGQGEKLHRFYKANTMQLQDFQIIQSKRQPKTEGSEPKNQNFNLAFNLAKEYQEKNIIPRKFNLPCKGTQQMDINLKGYYLRGKNSQALGQLLQTQSLKSLNLENTSLTKQSFKDIVGHMDHGPAALNLSKNKKSVESLVMSRILTQKVQTIKELNLEGQKLGTMNALELLRSIGQNRSLKILNLSENDLDDTFAMSARRMLEINESLEELYLHWNNLRSQGGALILEGVTTRDWVKVLDMSWNKIGSGSRNDKGSGMDSICRCLTKQKKSIVHLDLSYNHFNLLESKLIQAAIKDNKSLVGFHFGGNYGYVDIQGFLQIPDDFKQYQKPTLKPPHRIKGSKPCPQTWRLQPNSRYIDNCWICDSWQEQLFCWPASKNTIIESLMIHLSFDNFRGIEIYLNKTSTQYELTRMCPPGRVWFFFTVNKEHRTSLQYNRSEWPSKCVKNIVIGHKTIEKVDFDELNYVDIVPLKQIVDDDYDILVDIEPRVGEKILDISEEENEDDDKKDSDTSIQEPKIKLKRVRASVPQFSNQQWNLNDSLFKEYKKDNDLNLTTAFEYDWTHSKLQNAKFVQGEYEAIKQTLLTYFQTIKDIFRYLSSFSYNHNVFAVSQSVFQEFLQCFNLTHPLYLKSSTIELRMLEVLKAEVPSTKNSQQTIQLTRSSMTASQNPTIYNQIQMSLGMNRRDFLDCLTRIAHERFVKSGEIKSVAKAIEHMMENVLIPAFKGYECDTWRYKRYWNPKCEKVIRRYWLTLQWLYQRYSGSKVRSFSGLKCLFVEEFYFLIVDTGLGSKISDREVAVCFSLSLSTHQNEIDTDRHLYLNFLEFLEAIARVAEKISFPPLNARSDIHKIINLIYVPLCFKLEALCHHFTQMLIVQQGESHSPKLKRQQSMLMNPTNLVFEKYYEQILERKKTSRNPGKLAKRTLDLQHDCILKWKFRKAILLEIVFDDGLGIFKTDEKSRSIVNLDSQLSLDDIQDFEPSF